MLRRLSIRDYLLVRRVELDFHSGLSVLTGETGAGKSMILGALDVLLGEKPPRDPVAAGAERAVIEGEFQMPQSEVLAEILAAEDREGDELRLRREITPQGRTRVWLNDRPLPQDALLKLREILADFHGQREQQSLFKPSCQLEYLDAFAGAGEAARKVAELYSRRVSQKRELERLRASLTTHRKDRALLEYQLQEIERLGLGAGEEEEIEARLVKLENAEKLATDASRLLAILSEADSSLVALGGRARQTAAAIALIDRDLNDVATELGDIASRLKDLAEQVRHYLDGLNFEEAELSRLRERRGLLWEMKRKHGLTVEQILQRAGELKRLLAEGQTLEDSCRALEESLAGTDRELTEAARRLSEMRHVAAREFSESVVETMKPLGFSHPRFEVRVETPPEPLDPEKMTADGADRVSFLFCANPGGRLAPLGEIASGGESSRVTLAIRSVLSEKAEYPLMVYDEMDLGISGRVADQVGKALHRLARRHQVIVVTHLPQIASRADHHLAVYKSTRDGGAETTAKFISGDERVQAVAALIAGAKVTEKSLASASELLRQKGS
jgi:DNA repair protein RecN (Recombination protein N)